MTQTSGGTCDVVVCCYNHGAYIEKAIGSVLGQDSARLGTIFVCDDASPDNTAEVVARVKATSDLGHKIQWHGRLVNAGPAINFREGVMRVTSPYIAFLDGDDYWSHPSKLTHQLALLDSEPQMVYCGHEYVFMEEDGSLHGVFPQTQRPDYVRRRLPNLGEIEQIIVNPDLLFTENTCGFHMNAVVGHSAILQQTLLPEWDDLKVGDWPWFWLTSELGEVGLIKARWANNIKHQGSAFNEFMAAKKIIYIIQMLLRLGLSQNIHNRAINQFLVRNYQANLQRSLSQLKAEELHEFTETILQINEPELITIVFAESLN